jgi:S-adenosylmethionine/arginine decarboxylase-like enzyme
MIDMMNKFGLHMTVDAKNSPVELIDDETNIREFVKKLLIDIEMTAYGDCVVKRFGNDPRLAGYSFFQLIEESNVSAHFCPYDYMMTDKEGNSYNNKGASYIDIFSCKDFDPKIVLNVVNDFFKPKEVTYNLVERF